MASRPSSTSQRQQRYSRQQQRSSSLRSSVSSVSSGRGNKRVSFSAEDSAILDAAAEAAEVGTGGDYADVGSGKRVSFSSRDAPLIDEDAAAVPPMRKQVSFSSEIDGGGGVGDGDGGSDEDDGRERSPGGGTGGGVSRPPPEGDGGRGLVREQRSLRPRVSFSETSSEIPVVGPDPGVAAAAATATDELQRGGAFSSFSSFSSFDEDEDEDEDDASGGGDEVEERRRRRRSRQQQQQRNRHRQGSYRGHRRRDDLHRSTDGARSFGYDPAADDDDDDDDDDDYDDVIVIDSSSSPSRGGGGEGGGATAWMAWGHGRGGGGGGGATSTTSAPSASVDAVGDDDDTSGMRVTLDDDTDTDDDDEGDGGSDTKGASSPSSSSPMRPAHPRKTFRNQIVRSMRSFAKALHDDDEEGVGPRNEGMKETAGDDHPPAAAAVAAAAASASTDADAAAPTPSPILAESILTGKVGVFGVGGHPSDEEDHHDDDDASSREEGEGSIDSHQIITDNDEDFESWTGPRRTTAMLPGIGGAIDVDGASADIGVGVGVGDGAEAGTKDEAGPTVDDDVARVGRVARFAEGGDGSAFRTEDEPGERSLPSSASPIDNLELVEERLDPPLDERKQGPSHRQTERAVLGDDLSSSSSSSSSASTCSTTASFSSSEEEDFPLDGVVPTVFTSVSAGSTGLSTSSQSPHQQQPPSQYFDQSLRNNISPDMARHFAHEHKIFLRAVLDLIAEREREEMRLEQARAMAAVVNVDEALTGEIIRSGWLMKKSSISKTYKRRFVEVRGGILSYRESNSTSSSLVPSSFIAPCVATIAPAIASGEACADHRRVHSEGSGGDALLSAGGHPPSSSSLSSSSMRGMKHVVLRPTLCSCRAVSKHEMIPNISAAYHHHASSSSASGGVGLCLLELTVRQSAASTAPGGGGVGRIGGPTTKKKLLWMAASTEERDDWVRAINEGITAGGEAKAPAAASHLAHGSSSPHDPTPSCRAEDLDQYQAVHRRGKASISKEDHLEALSDLWGTSLTVPIQWIKDTFGASGVGAHARLEELEKARRKSSSSTAGLNQLWKDMGRDSVSINWFVLKGDGGHGVERTIGALTRCILDFDRAHPLAADVLCRMTEIQAITYARDILMACNRTRSGGDSYYAADTLVGKAGLVVLCPSSTKAEPLAIVVKNVDNHQNFSALGGSADDQENNSNAEAGMSEKRGWVTTRTSHKKPWKSRFCIVSGGVLSYFEKEHPRPSGLREQLELAGATMGVSEVSANSSTAASNDGGGGEQSSVGGRGGARGDTNVRSHSKSEAPTTLSESLRRSSLSSTRYLVCILTKDRAKERHLCFDDRKDFLEWQRALERAIEFSPPTIIPEDSSPSLHSLRKGAGKLMLSKNLFQSMSRVDSGVGGESSHPTSSSSKQALNRAKGIITGASRRPFSTNSSSISENSTSTDTRSPHGQTRTDSTGNLSPPTVQVDVQASTVYKICTADPTGDDSKDTWAMVRTKFLQTFHLCGGSKDGQMIKGKEIVQMGFLKGHLFREETFDLIFANDIA